MAAHVMIHIKPEDVPPEGLQVKYRLGECFEKKVEWGEITDGKLLPTPSANDLKEPGLCIDDLDSPGYAGFESRTGNYWRYGHESDPDVFREYCLQITEINEPFTPRSSWEAWSILTQSILKERLRLTLKNRITGAELSYKVVDKGFGYQIKHLTEGRRVQKLLKHDYVLNQLLGTSFKKLNPRLLSIETDTHDDIEGGGNISLSFKDDGYLLKYRLNLISFTLGLFQTTEDGLELLKMVELPHSSVLEETRTFLG